MASQIFDNRPAPPVGNSKAVKAPQEVEPIALEYTSVNPQSQVFSIEFAVGIMDKQDILEAMEKAIDALQEIGTAGVTIHTISAAPYADSARILRNREATARIWENLSAK